MTTVLFFTPFIRRAPDVESLIFALKKQGHKVIFATQDTGEFIIPVLQSHGIKCYSRTSSRQRNFGYHLSQLIFFIRLCWTERVDIVFSHLDSANFVASIGQFFVRGNVVLTRHHVNEANLYKYSTSFSYRVTNLLAKRIIVVSRAARDYMIREEGVRPDKIMHINLAYDFARFPTPDQETVCRIKKSVGGQLVLVTVSRLTRFKRTDLSIELLAILRKQGLDAKLVILGTGEDEKSLQEFAVARHIHQHVFFEGHVFNVQDYLSLADFVIHPSVLESSCVVIKEAGIACKPVIVCRGIGDFDDYIRDEENGFLVDPENFVPEATRIITSFFQKKNSLSAMGNKLRDDIIRLFDVTSIVEDYSTLISQTVRNRT